MRSRYEFAKWLNESGVADELRRRAKAKGFDKDLDRWLRYGEVVDEFHAVLEEAGIVASQPANTITHKVPRIPVMIDDSRAEPEAVKEFEFGGPALHTVVDRDALDNKVLRIFTDEDRAKEYVTDTLEESSPSEASRKGSRRRSHNPHNNPDGPPGGVPPDGGYVDLYEHVDMGGCRWRVLESTSKTVRAFSALWECGTLCWGWVNANNNVSAVDFRISGAKPVVVLAEFSNLGGSWIWFPGRSWVPSLVPYGWNDRASSLIMMYF
jgi:hypothetical protein